MDDGETGLLTRHPWVARRRLDVREYYLMGQTGILGEDDRVELIEGQLVMLTPISSSHCGAINATSRALIRAVGEQAIVSVQNPIRLDEHNEPQPDFLLLRPRADDYRARTPMPYDVLLLIEVADSSLRYDRTVKLPLYASHGIAEVWIVDLPANVVECSTAPSVDGYAQTVRQGRGARLAPLLLPGVTIPASAILG